MNQNAKQKPTYDPRYAFVTCSGCGRKWQRIDYRSASHALTCGRQLPAQVEPIPNRALTPEQWEAFDDANGVENSIAKAVV